MIIKKLQYLLIVLNIPTFERKRANLSIPNPQRFTNIVSQSNEGLK